MLLQHTVAYLMSITTFICRTFPAVWLRKVSQQACLRTVHPTRLWSAQSDSSSCPTLQRERFVGWH